MPWSLKLHQYCGTIKYWRRIVRLRKGVNTSRSELKHLAKRLHISMGLHTDLDLVVLELKQTYKMYYKQTKPNAGAWRDEHNQG